MHCMCFFCIIISVGWSRSNKISVQLYHHIFVFPQKLFSHQVSQRSQHFNRLFQRLPNLFGVARDHLGSEEIATMTGNTATVRGMTFNLFCIIIFLPQLASLQALLNIELNSIYELTFPKMGFSMTIYVNFKKKS